MTARPMTEAEEAAFVLGSPAHRRHFIEQAAIALRVAYTNSEAGGTTSIMRAQNAVGNSVELWMELERQLAVLK